MQHSACHCHEPIRGNSRKKVMLQNDVVADGLGVNYTAVNAENAAALKTLMQLATAQQAQSMVLQNVAWYQGDPAYPLLFYNYTAMQVEPLHGV